MKIWAVFSMVYVPSYAQLVILVLIQELSSCWDGRPFGHNRHGPKVAVQFRCIISYIT